jgi:hypothetical protein
MRDIQSSRGCISGQCADLEISNFITVATQFLRTGPEKKGGLEY